MAITGTSALTGTMDWAAVQTNLDAWRTWINGGSIAGDFAADGLAREAFYRPDIGPFPVDGYLGQSQQLWWLHLRNNEQGVTDSSGARYQEIFIVQPKLLGINEIVRTDISRRIYLPGTRWVSVSVQLTLLSRNAAGTATYPTGAGGDYGGRFGIYEYDFATDIETVHTESEGFVYPNAPPSTYTDNLEMHWAGSLGQGWHDIYVAYDLDGANVDFEQLELLASSMKIEAYWQEQ